MTLQTCVSFFMKYSTNTGSAGLTVSACTADRQRSRPRTLNDRHWLNRVLGSSYLRGRPSEEESSTEISLRKKLPEARMSEFGPGWIFTQ
ncbi:hypothetical protein AGOR_G00220160 [Albula goreensis]|uniref:Uncharacterized protein n=1 Tax=Albula goreensis TaxID=1534307 RepID=A0A8T3CNK1_9TELE|nr:hypothetical protein AGOR_G00220160 [Albula goreensis]